MRESIRMSKKKDQYFEEELLPRYERIYRLVRVSVRSEKDAEDITQTVFEKAYKKLWQLRDLEWGPLWLRSIARNEVRQYERDLAKTPKVVFLEDEKENLKEETTSGDLSDLLLREELHRNLEKALWLLDERYREIVALRLLWGIPLIDIARDRNLNVNTVRSRMRRGLIQLRKHLKALEEEGDEDV